MKFYLDNTSYIDTDEPIDISISLSNTDHNPRAWYVNHPKFEPVRTEHYIGSVMEGGSVNFRDIYFNPHGHGTHTECLGHITSEVYSVNQVMKTFFFQANLISVQPQEKVNTDGTVDFIIEADQLKIESNTAEALIVRTLPNEANKRSKNYSSTNPPFFNVECVDKLIKSGVVHFLTDLPSVDKESDEGKLVFHHAFWEVPNKPNFERTITELIFVENEIADGQYIINFHLAPFENDASPSRPVLYKIKKS